MQRLRHHHLPGPKGQGRPRVFNDRVIGKSGETARVVEIDFEYGLETLIQNLAILDPSKYPASLSWFMMNCLVMYSDMRLYNQRVD